MNKTGKLALVLGGGGARGLAHLGVLKVLKTEGIIQKIDLVVGVSMGALIGAYYALGNELDSLEQEAVRFNRRIFVKKVVDLGWPKQSLLQGRKVYNYIHQLLGDKNFEDTLKSFYIVATDLSNGKEVILKRGKLTDAIMASAAVPGIFPPMRIGNKLLVDGGLVNPTPISVARRFGATRIIAVDFMLQKVFSEPHPKLWKILLQSYEIIRMQAVRSHLKDMDKDTVLITPAIRGTIDSFKFHQINKFIKSGQEAAMVALPKIKKLL